MFDSNCIAPSNNTHSWNHST